MVVPDVYAQTLRGVTLDPLAHGHANTIEDKPSTFF